MNALSGDSCMPHVVKRFVKLGADLNLADHEGHTALMHAIESRNIACMKRQGNSETPNYRGVTP